MKTVIVGAGSVGFQLAKQLVDGKKDVVVIEDNAERAAEVSNLLDCLVITGNGTSVKELKTAGLDNADSFVAVTNSDEKNMIACSIVATEFSVPIKIARVRSINYDAIKIAQHRFLGIDFVVNPDMEAARAIVRSVTSGAVSDIMAFERSKVQIRSVVVEHDGPLRGRLLYELNMLFHVSFLIAVIVREGEHFIPVGSTELRIGDILYFVATERDFEKIFAVIGKKKQVLRQIVIVGGGRIAEYVVTSFLDRFNKNIFHQFAHYLMGSYQIKIIDRDKKRCEALAEQFSDVLVLHADVSNDGVFDDEDMQQADVIISATENQELNIVTALYAKNKGIKRTVALVNRGTYLPIAAQLGIDVPVGLKTTVVNTILRLVRRDGAHSLHSISDGKVEAVEFTIAKNSKAVGKSIQSLALPRDVLVVAIERNNYSIVPSGGSVLYHNDHLVIIAAKQHTNFVQELFAG